MHASSLPYARILVTDGHERAALAAVRSLGRAGHEVHVCSPRRRSLAGASRYAATEAMVPGSLNDASGFLRALERLRREWRFDVLLPISEASLLAVLPQRDRFPDVAIPFPRAEVFRTGADKRAVLQIAESLGIVTPTQHVLHGPERIEELSLESLRFPVVVKPSRSVAEADGRSIKLGVRYATEPAQLAAELWALPEVAYPVLVQQRIEGPAVGVFLLLWEGQTVAAFAHRRIREKPPSGGVSVYRESIAADPALVERSHALLERMSWEGVAMVEYKLEAASGIPYLMEVNGRFWGSLQLAIDAGVDFPALLVALATKRPIPEVGPYRTGIRSRWWWGDVDQLLIRLSKRRGELDLPARAPTAWRALAEFLILWRPGDRSEVLRLGDMRPFLRESADWLLYAMRRSAGMR